MNKFKKTQNIFDKINQYIISVFILEVLLIWCIMKEWIIPALCILSAMFIYQNANFVKLWQDLKSKYENN